MCSPGSPPPPLPSLPSRGRHQPREDPHPCKICGPRCHRPDEIVAWRIFSVSLKKLGFHAQPRWASPSPLVASRSKTVASGEFCPCSKNDVSGVRSYLVHGVMNLFLGLIGRMEGGRNLTWFGTPSPMPRDQRSPFSDSRHTRQDREKDDGGVCGKGVLMITSYSAPTNFIEQKGLLGSRCGHGSRPDRQSWPARRRRVIRHHFPVGERSASPWREGAVKFPFF